MEFKEAILTVFNNYANFSGRSRRSEYWYFALFTGVVSGALSSIRQAFGDGAIGTFFGLVAGLFSLVVLVPGLAVAWRRLHDTGRSGGYWFFVLIPIVGWIIVLVWLAQDSQPGVNQYGPNPKEPDSWGGSGYGGTGYGESGGESRDDGFFNQKNSF